MPWPPPAEEPGEGGFSGGGAGQLGGLGSVGDLRVGRQSALTAPVGLPEAPVQLFQLWAQGQVAGQVHAEGLQPMFQLYEAGPGVTGGWVAGLALLGISLTCKDAPGQGPQLTSSQGPNHSSAQ